MQRAQASPSSPVKFSWDGEFSYEQLNGFLSRLAQRHRDLGVKGDSIAPFCFRKSAYTIISMLATLKARIIQVALTADFPIDRLMHIVHSTEAHVVLAEAGHSNVFGGLVFSVAIHQEFLSLHQVINDV